jgi:hypothetical protein
MAKRFGERVQQPVPKRAGTAAGTGQTNGCAASHVPDSNLPSGDDYA